MRSKRQLQHEGSHTLSNSQQPAAAQTGAGPQVLAAKLSNRSLTLGSAEDYQGTLVGTNGSPGTRGPTQVRGQSCKHKPQVKLSLSQLLTRQVKTFTQMLT